MVSNTPLLFERLASLRSRYYMTSSLDWHKWRLTYEGGVPFRDEYLERWSERENQTEFERRRRLTPIPTHGKAAINKIKNNVFQRFCDILRRGGSKEYQESVSGTGYGIDGRGSSMNVFLGSCVLPDLLVMGRVGVFVDAPALAPMSLADEKNGRPYIYSYPVECIPYAVPADIGSKSDFKEVLLIDRAIEPSFFGNEPPKEEKYRYLWMNESGKVDAAFVNMKGEPISDVIHLDLDAIPFVMVDIGDSLMKDVCDHQIALLNMSSGDTAYALEANYPFLVREKDRRPVGDHLKTGDTTVETGTRKGLLYGKDEKAPAFISPPTDPIMVSMQMRRELKEEIYNAVNLAVDNLKGGDPGLDSGLAYIGLMLEAAEQRIADHIAAYENPIPERRDVATIKYPEQWHLKTQAERIEDADALTGLMYKVPGTKIKKELAKLVAQSLLIGKVATEVLDDIAKEIDGADFSTSDPEIIFQAKELGLCDDETGCKALGFADGVAEKARAQHVERAKELLAAQGGPGGGFGRPGARGVPDASANPNGDGKEEKAASRNTDLDATAKKKTRGEGKDNNEEE